MSETPQISDICCLTRLESEDELFRPPTLEYSSSSSDEDDGAEVFERESFLPSIGPPKILQYVKESVNPPFTNECAIEEVAARFQTPTSSREGHSCAFCKVEALEKSLTAEHVCLAEAVSLLQSTYIISDVHSLYNLLVKKSN